MTNSIYLVHRLLTAVVVGGWLIVMTGVSRSIFMTGVWNCPPDLTW